MPSHLSLLAFIAYASVFFFSKMSEPMPVSYRVSLMFSSSCLVFSTLGFRSLILCEVVFTWRDKVLFHMSASSSSFHTQASVVPEVLVGAMLYHAMP